MAFTYTPIAKKPWEINLKKLRHRYYAQLTPDGEHLVTGQLHQGTPPAIGDWLQVGTIKHPLAERYFVQQTRFNTLVPGSLVMSPEQPGSTWKDVRKLSEDVHYIYFDSIPFSYLDLETETTVINSEDFLDEYVNPILAQVYPDRNPSTSLTLQLFYLRGNIATLGFYPEYLTKFRANTTLRWYLPDSETYANTLQTIAQPAANLTIQPDAQNGNYNLILGVLNTTNGEIEEYIVLVNMINKFLPA